MSSRQVQKAIEENPTLELKIVSASDITHTDDTTDKLDIYAVVSINGNTTQKAAKTPIDYDGGSNPTWNHTVKFSINEREVNEGLINIKIEFFSYWLEGKDDFYLGEVNVNVNELLTLNPLPPFVNGNVVKMKLLTCPIKVKEGGSNNKAMLNLLYRFKPVPVNDFEPKPSIGQPVYPNPQYQTATTKLILEIVIKFAKDIENVNALSSMDVYASVAILKDRKVKDRINTPIDFNGNTNPKWNQKIKFLLDDEKLGQERSLILLVELMSHRPFLGDKEIGFVRIPIQQLLISNPPKLGDETKLETHAITGSYGKKGILSFTYRFLAKQVSVSPSATSQPYIMYLPVTDQSNGLVPIYMPPTYQSHGYQQYSPRHLQPQTQTQTQTQLKSMTRQAFSQSVSDTQEA